MLPSALGRGRGSDEVVNGNVRVISPGASFSDSLELGGGRFREIGVVTSEPVQAGAHRGCGFFCSSRMIRSSSAIRRRSLAFSSSGSGLRHVREMRITKRDENKSRANQATLSSTSKAQSPVYGRKK